ncbi:phosphonate C-P lyase system protein PhnH [Halarcobacter anaerophilus]|uniref:Phosphonate C-P lyase system protein PhnH n=1 Tax=Halarcobacter anaerophilus TaxID=877500 RepID=A0A4Q0Y493_9BACT|nr:phosphonate C-P lyase system protein PhnH [Halarcobacter anaerophilus]QDF28889.1 carbon-phosphorus lyase core complex subunit PhnH [Halarcobacter anaerophilus]RXJ63529.1 phosphonate C-P lyase system protein PhnH [Halarcobacter anaerophilus]
MDTIDLERLNRENFRVMMNVLSKPGTIEKITPVFDSSFLALANTLLYAEVSHFYRGIEEFELIKAITNSKEDDENSADYVFCDEINRELFSKGKIGTSKDPEFSSTYIFKCKNFNKTQVRLRGPGIDEIKETTLPVNKDFIELFNEKNATFPLGNEIFFIDEDSRLIALSRTTKVEVV